MGCELPGSSVGGLTAAVVASPRRRPRSVSVVLVAFEVLFQPLMFGTRTPLYLYQKRSFER